MSKKDDVVSGSGPVCSDKDAADCLAQGHPKSSGNVPIAWGQKNRTADGDGPDDDARLQSFGKGKGGKADTL